MQVEDVMTNEVVSVLPNDNISTVAKQMEKYNIGLVPVCENGTLLGVITDRDITLRCVAKDRLTTSVLASEIMSSDAISISPNQSIEVAASIMSDAQYRRLLVTDQGKVVGIFSLGDLAKLRSYKSETAKALSEISEDR